MSKVNNPLQIAVTGPESTGKTTLSLELANHYKGTYFPEIARSFMENLGRPYTYNDVVKVAILQAEQIEKAQACNSKIAIFDTHMIITRVWFEVVYQKMPDWLISLTENLNVDLFLLCNTDIPWVPDKVRENGGEKREWLLQRYMQLIRELGYPFVLINGESDARRLRAIEVIDEILKKNTDS